MPFLLPNQQRQRTDVLHHSKLKFRQRMHLANELCTELLGAGYTIPASATSDLKDKARKT